MKIHIFLKSSEVTVTNIIITSSRSLSRREGEAGEREEEKNLVRRVSRAKAGRDENWLLLLSTY